MRQDQATKDRFQLALCGLWQTLNPTKEFPIETQRGYFQALQDLPIAHVEMAIHKAMASCTFFPAPVELRKLSGVADEVKLNVAWNQLIRALDAYGSAHFIRFEDPVLSTTVRHMGGLRSICLLYTSPSPRDQRGSRMPSSA